MAQRTVSFNLQTLHARPSNRHQHGVNHLNEIHIQVIQIHVFRLDKICMHYFRREDGRFVLELEMLQRISDGREERRPFGVDIERP